MASKKSRQDAAFDARFEKLLRLQETFQEYQQNTTEQINKLSVEANNLRGYNNNRDEELEITLETKLLDYLFNQGWDAMKIRNVNYIYSSKDKVLTELDGIIFGTHESYPDIGFFFFLEAKQVFDLRKYRLNFVTKIPILTKTLDELPEDKGSSNTKYYSMCKALRMHKLKRSNYRVVGIIGSPCIDSSLIKRFTDDHVSTITLSSDHYVVNLFIE